MGRRRSCTMLRKIHAIFHPSSHRRHLSDGIPAGDGSAVRLIRSTSMYVLEEPKLSGSLKKSKRSTSLDSVACLQLKEEEKTWMYSKTQDCLQYLQDLLALRKKYIESIKDLKSLDRTSQMSPLSTKSSNARKNPPAPPPPVQSSKISAERKVSHFNAEVTEAIAYFDTIIAELDAERHRKIIVRDYPHADVDFDVVTSSREHSLHSNWILRAPRRYSQDPTPGAKTKSLQSEGSNQGRTIGSRKKLERYPIYLPKAVEGAFNTWKFKPKMCPKQH